MQLRLPPPSSSIKDFAVTKRPILLVTALQRLPVSQHSVPADNSVYRLQATKMATQPLTGNVADAGNLDKLPPEIRKQIYTHLLVEPKTIAIERYTTAHRKSEVVRMNHHRKADHRMKVYDRRRKAWVDAPPATTSILLVNKVICQEATPVFYGSNDFFFDNAGALRDFLTWIGQSRQHLRHVEIAGHDGRRHQIQRIMDCY